MPGKGWFRAVWVLLFLLVMVPWGLAYELPFENSRFWENERCLLHYRVWYPALPKGKVFLIHGLGGSTFSWRHAPHFLVQAGYVVVAVDLPGFGYSGRVEGPIHKPENRARFLLEFLSVLDRELVPPSLVGTKWHLVGHSMGGATAFLMAMEAPERFQGVVFIDAAFRGPSLRLLRVFTSFPLTRGCWATVIRNAFLKRRAIRRRLASFYGRKATEEEIDGYFIPLRRPGTARSLLSLVNYSSSLQISRLRSRPHPPFLLIWGERDSAVSLKQGERFQKLFPGTPLQVIPGAAHCPMETHPEAVYPLMIRFFSSWEGDAVQGVGSMLDPSK